MTINKPLEFVFLRRELIGADAVIDTPFGEHLMIYADYTASGLCLCFVENYLRRLQRIYDRTPDFEHGLMWEINHIRQLPLHTK
jgi:hypothetical protein